MSDDELELTFDGYCFEIERQEALRPAQEAAAIRAWEKHLANLVSLGASGVRGAIRWDMQAHGVEAHDVGFYCYLQGIPHRLERQIEETLAA